MSSTALNGTSEVQSIEVASSTFQIGFRGVYTGLLVDNTPLLKTVPNNNKPF